MGRPFFKNAERRVGGLGIVQFPERVNQEDVEDIPRTARCRWAGAGMKFLGYLVGEAQAAHGRCHGNSQLGESLNVGINEVHRTRSCRSEINFNGLPGAGPILNSNFDTNRVGLFHIPSSRFDSKCKIVESQLQDGR